MKRPARKALILLTAALVAAGCGTNGPAPNVRILDEMAAVTGGPLPQADGDVFDPATQTLKLFAASNETVCFQAVIDAGEEALEGISFRLTDLAAGAGKVIDGGNAAFFRMLPVRVRGYPAWHLRLADSPPTPHALYDPLVPFESGDALHLPAGERLAVWVDLYVPRGTAAGEYTGALRVSAAGREEYAARVELKVHDFVLPDARALTAVGVFDHRTVFRTLVRQNDRPFEPLRLDRTRPPVREGLQAVRQLMRIAHEHRLDLVDSAIRPVLGRDRFGTLRVDWEDYDAIVTPYLTGSAFEDQVGCTIWPSPFCEDWPRIADYGGIDSEAYAETAAAVIEECRRHFAALTGAGGKIFYWPCRGETAPPANDNLPRLAQLIRAADPQAPILSMLPAQAPTGASRPAPDDAARSADIHAPSGISLERGQPAAADGQHIPPGTWMRPGKPPYLPSLDAAAGPADVRAIPWFAVRYQCSALLLEDVLDWSEEPDAAEAHSAARLFYPGTVAGAEGVLPSVRLKRLRRGLQDLSYLMLLRLRGRHETAGFILNALIRYGGVEAAGDSLLDPRLDGWVKDPVTWRLARRILAGEVESAVQAAGLTPQDNLADQLTRKRFDERVRRVGVEDIRCAVTPAEDAGFLAKLSVCVQNEYPRGVQVEARIDALPDGWRPVGSQAVSAPLAPGERHALDLTVHAETLPATADGKAPLQLALSVEGRLQEALAAAVPAIQAGRTVSPPKIDGQLDDWPLRAGNTAGGFKLVGMRGRAGSGLAEEQTLAFVLCDERNLYFAFRCEQPEPQALVARASNAVGFEELLAVGEDLVELVIDPGRQAAGPEDLYHVIVKSNGVLIASRGIRCSPPLCAAQPWAADIAAAVGRQDGAWTVELAIPRTAFGQAGQQAAWGVQFARFATQKAEASSWTGAPRHFYNPGNLGTLLVPSVE